MTLLYNGIQYEIENEEDQIEKISVDNEDEDELETQEANIILVDAFSESAWEPENVHLFLDECIKRKEALHDPKVRRRKVFSDIREIMKEKGYRFRIESLDRKLRNMKIHYLVSRENNKKSLKRAHWPYYDKLKALYPNESRRNQSISSSRKRSARVLDSYSSPPAQEESAPTSPTSPIQPAYKIERLSESPECTYTFPEDIDESINSCHPTDYTNNKMEALRTQILSYEERRTVAAEQILNELRESNRLKRELLDLNIKLFHAETEKELANE